jgi:hypothetical protein
MGFRDALRAVLGGTRLPRANLDRLFAITTAGITLQTSLDLRPSRTAGLCFKPIESSRYAEAKTEIEELLEFGRKETGSAWRLETDAYRFTWVIVEDPEIEDLVTGIHMVSQTLIERGLGTYLLCAIFRFENAKPVYWIYAFKQGTFYPFVPGPEKTRDSAFEFRLRAILERELPIEKDVEQWYPLWGIPF